MRNWGQITLMWRCFWFGVIVGVAIAIFVSGNWHHEHSTAVFIWSAVAWIPLWLPDLFAWIARTPRQQRPGNIM